MDYFNAFWTGGLICALVQILLDKTKLLPGRVMVLLVCSGALLSFLGFYQPFARFCRCRRHGSAARIRTYFMERYGKKQSPKMDFSDCSPVVLLPAPSVSPQP